MKLLKNFVFSVLASIFAGIVLYLLDDGEGVANSIKKGVVGLVSAKDPLQYFLNDLDPINRFLILSIQATASVLAIAIIIRISKILIAKVKLGQHAQLAGLDNSYVSISDLEKMYTEITNSYNTPTKPLTYVGTTGYNSFIKNGEMEAPLANVFKSGVPIDFYLMDPSMENIDALKERAKQINMNTTEFRQQIIDTLHEIKCRNNKGDSHVFLYRGKPRWKIYANDKNIWVQEYLIPSAKSRIPFFKFKESKIHSQYGIVCMYHFFRNIIAAYRTESYRVDDLDRWVAPPGLENHTFNVSKRSIKPVYFVLVDGQYREDKRSKRNAL